MQILYLVTVGIFAIAIIVSIIIMKITYNQEIRLKKVSEKISDGYVIFNKFLKITNYNRAFLKFTNLKEKDINRKNIRNVILKTDLKQNDKNKILKELDNIENKKSTKLLINKKSKTYEFEIMSLVDNDIFMRYVILIKDVTKNYKAVEDLKVNQETLANREKFASLGGLITGIMHSLKSPIFSITGELEGLIDLIEEYAESTGDESVSDEDNKEIVKEMRLWIRKNEGADGSNF